jgi:hypothetical protein
VLAHHRLDQGLVADAAELGDRQPGLGPERDERVGSVMSPFSPK